MVILGISSFVHDSAACLIISGKMVANVEEERFDRIKHTRAFPVRAIDYVMKQGKIRLADVDVIAYNWNPYRSAVIEATKLVMAPIIYFKVLKHARPPKNFRSIAASLRLKKTINRIYPGEFRGRVICVSHHLAHAASSYYLAPFNRQDADVIVADGHGEDCSTSVFSERNNTLELKWKSPVWNSLGILYTTFTNFLGFENYQEGKTMALASYGRDTFREPFQRILELRPDGQYAIPNQKYLGLYRDILPGITHVDGTARVQVVSMAFNHDLFQLLLEFEKLTGYAVLINTSFNVQEPIVCSPEDALNCFAKAPLDVLFMGDFMVCR